MAFPVRGLELVLAAIGYGSRIPTPLARLATADPSNGQWQHDLAYIKQQLAEVDSAVPNPTTNGE